MSDPGAEPRLVVPEGLVIDESARERLERQLARAAPAVTGVAAESAALAPGASYRVHAEWTALDSSWTSAAAGSGAPGSAPVRGAVLVRPDVEFAVREGRVEVACGTVLVDPGAHVYDPFRAIGPLEPASERGRPPFPRRPVVVFLAGDSQLGASAGARADWVRRLVNRLVRRDVEARIALPDLPETGPALQLTRPCRAGAETIHALAPDVVVTLDATAAQQVEAWCAGNRSTVVVEFSEALDDPMELVSWKIGHASGRLRARIGPRVDAPAFASLVVRLCAGPQPAPPADEPELLHVRAPVREHWKADTEGAAPGCVVLTGILDAPAGARIEGLVDNLTGAGVEVLTATLPAIPPGARDARLVVLRSVTPGLELDALIRERRRAGLPTALDVGPGDIEGGAGSMQSATLTQAAAALADACGLLVAPGGALLTAARRTSARVLLLPTVLPRSRAAALREARVPIDPAAVRVIGWRPAAPGGDGPAYSRAVGDGLARYLIDSGDHIEIVGDPALVPASLRGHERVSVVPHSEMDAGTVAAWAAHIWTPALTGGEIADDARVLEEASCAGVPSVMPADAGSGVDGLMSPHVLVPDVTEPDHWFDALHHVLDDRGTRARRAEEARRRADALDGAAASKAVVSRLMSWATYEQPDSIGSGPISTGDLGSGAA